MADHLAGITCSKDVGGYIFGHHTTSANHTARTDGDTRINNRATPYPAIVANGDGAPCFQAAAAASSEWVAV